MIATFTISTQPLEYYSINIWLHPMQKAIYVSHLAVLPNFQGKGIGTWSMGTIEGIATDWGCVAVRLDAYEKHDELIKFYNKLGYRRRGIIKYQGLRLVCFEKIIKNSE
jgi:GNAT superfamily N-acetyltransferase